MADQFHGYLWAMFFGALDPIKKQVCAHVVKRSLTCTNQRMLTYLLPLLL